MSILNIHIHNTPSENPDHHLVPHGVSRSFESLRPASRLDRTGVPNLLFTEFDRLRCHLHPPAHTNRLLAADKDPNRAHHLQAAELKLNRTVYVRHGQRIRCSLPKRLEKRLSPLGRDAHSALLRARCNRRYRALTGWRQSAPALRLPRRSLAGSPRL